MLYKCSEVYVSKANMAAPADKQGLLLPLAMVTPVSYTIMLIQLLLLVIKCLLATKQPVLVAARLKGSGRLSPPKRHPRGATGRLGKAQNPKTP